MCRRAGGRGTRRVSKGDTASCYTEVQMREGEMEWGWHYPKKT